MKKILVIDESSLFRNFIKQNLEGHGFEVITALNGLDGSAKIRSAEPDLLIIDHNITRKPILQFLEDKKNNPNTAGIPTIVISDKINKETILKLGPYNIKKFFQRPVKIDALLSEISEILNILLEVDKTPCILETHLNDNILFIEIAMGLNTEKIGLLSFNISELSNLYHLKTPRVLLLMSDLEIKKSDYPKLELLFSQILDYTEGKTRLVKILSRSKELNVFLRSKPELNQLDMVDSLEIAMDGLLGRAGLEKSSAEQDNIHAKFLQSKNPEMDQSTTINLKLESDLTNEQTSKEASFLAKNLKIAIVDDDFIVQQIVKTTFSKTNWTVVSFDNGKEFVKNLKEDSFDLVFLDLMMPEMNGFQVLEHLRKINLSIPISILSALSRKETVIKALDYNIKSYIIKPVKTQEILKKTLEILNRNF